MSFDAYHVYLTDLYRSPTSGKPLQRGTASDYVSRLGRLQTALQTDIESATPSALRSLLDFLKTGPVALPKKFVGDVGPAIRLYADFLELTAETGATSLLHAAGTLQDALDAGQQIDRAETIRAEIEILKTEAQAIVDVRRGQQRFRRALDRYWNGCCVLTNIGRSELLRASHIKPWSVSSDAERIDPFNGLLLAVHVDALFDRALISFGEAGQILVSSRLSDRERTVFGIPLPRQTIRLTPAHQGYMRHHRDRFAATA
jgi:hypothetical protein